jgi:hypothetical protein
MKIRKDEQILVIGDYRIVRRDDLNLVVEQKTPEKWEFVGYYSYVSHAVARIFRAVINNARREFGAESILGEQVEEDKNALLSEIPAKSIEDIKEDINNLDFPKVSRDSKKILNVKGELD